MVENKNALLITLVVLVIAMCLVNTFVALGSRVDEKDIADKVTAQVISKMPVQEKVPTAAEIAALITVPGAPEVTIPEFKSDEKVNDLWKNLYADEIEELETKAYNIAVEELEDRDYRLLTKWLKSQIVGFDELESVNIKDFEVTVVELGLDEDEDKVATVEFELKVRYTLLEGTDDDFKKTVKCVATVTFDEGDFTDESVELVFS